MKHIQTSFQILPFTLVTWMALLIVMIKNSRCSKAENNENSSSEKIITWEKEKRWYREAKRLKWL